MGVETPKDVIQGLPLALWRGVIRFPLQQESHYGEFLKRDYSRLSELLLAVEDLAVDMPVLWGLDVGRSQSREDIAMNRMSPFLRFSDSVST